MKEFLNKFPPIDFIAVIVIISASVLKGFGLDGTVSAILVSVVLFYFGEKKIAEKVKEKVLPEAKTETVEQTIIRITKERGIDPALAVRVARCESGLNPAAININTDKSKDRGLFQWNDKWHPEITDEIAFDPECATRAFCDAVSSGNISWWNASKKCWNV